MQANNATIVSNMKKPLYVQYVEEREGACFIEHKHGFLIYKVAPDHVYLQDIFVVKEERNSGLAKRLFWEFVGTMRSYGYTKIIGSVVPSAPGSTLMLKSMQELGFNLLSSSQDMIYLVKEI